MRLFTGNRDGLGTNSMAAATRRNMWQTWRVARAHDGTVEQWLREYPDNELMNWPYFQSWIITLCLNRSRVPQFLVFPSLCVNNKSKRILNILTWVSIDSTTIGLLGLQLMLRWSRVLMKVHLKNAPHYLITLITCILYK